MSQWQNQLLGACISAFSKQNSARFSLRASETNSYGRCTMRFSQSNVLETVRRVQAFMDRNAGDPQ